MMSRPATQRQRQGNDDRDRHRNAGDWIVGDSPLFAGRWSSELGELDRGPGTAAGGED
jgi:hypothetical protein